MHSACNRLVPIQEGMLFHHIRDAHSGVPAFDFHSERFVEARLRTFAYDGPVEWGTLGEHLSFLERLGHSQNLA